MSHHAYSPICDERNATRVGSDSETTFAVVYREPGQEALVEVHDESLGGLGLLFSAPPICAVGQEVTIVFATSIFTGSVMHIEVREDGRYLVGFCCESFCDVRSESMTDGQQVDSSG